MAEYQGAARDHQQPGHPANVFPGADPDRGNNHQQLCLDAGRVFLVCGAVVVTIPTAVDAANTTLAFVGFVVWILGACLCLLALTPAAPWAVRAGAAIASTVLKCLSLHVNY